MNDPETQTPPESPQGMDPATTETTTPAETPSTPAFEPLALDALALPEGFSFEGADAEATQFLELVNGAKLPKEEAEALLGLHAKFLERAASQMETAWDELQNNWRAEVEALPEVAKNPALAQANIAKILDKYGSEEARQALDVTGAGNNPHVVKMFLKLAADLAEQPPVSGAISPTSRSREQRIYGGTQ